MSETPVTVAVGGFEITSSHESAEDMVKALTPPDKDADKQPKVLEGEKPKSPESQAAALLGEKGGKASAEARKIKPIPDKPKEAKPETAVEEKAAAAPEPVQAEEEPEEVRGIESEPIKERILKAARKEAEAKREAREALAREAAIRAEYERLRYEQRPAEERQEAPQREKPPFKPEDFEDYEQYLDARDEWRRQKWEAEYAERAKVDAYRTQLDNAVQSFNGRVREAFGDEYEGRISEDVRELRPTFALTQNEPAGPLNVVADEIVSSEQAAGLMLYLSEHPEVFQRLATLPSPQAVQREMAKLEAKLEAQAEAAAAGNPAPVQAISKAKPPVRPVTGSPSTADPYEVSDTMDTTEWIRRRQAQEAAKRARR